MNLQEWKNAFREIEVLNRETVEYRRLSLWLRQQAGDFQTCVFSAIFPEFMEKTLSSASWANNYLPGASEPYNLGLAFSGACSQEEWNETENIMQQMEIIKEVQTTL